MDRDQLLEKFRLLPLRAKVRLVVGTVVMVAFAIVFITTNRQEASSRSSRPQPSTPEISQAVYDSAIQEIIAEPQVVEASWGPLSNATLFVSMRDNGSRRDGFAQYLCLLLVQKDIHGTNIRILDAASLSRGDGKLIGEDWCE